VAVLASRIVSTIHALDFTFDGAPAHVGCSLGIARYPEDATTLYTLFLLADEAMYKAKSRGKNNWIMHQQDS
jgi:diguanylate cyclase (GGDEF)-like protein